MSPCFVDYQIDDDACLALIYTWKRYEIVKESIESMMEEPGYPLRLWVIDNGNDDGTREYLLQKVYDGAIEKLIIEKRNWGIHHALNQWRALMKITSENPKIPMPKYCLITNDDMQYKPNWLKECVDTYEDLKRSPYEISIVSPFHCRHLDGNYAKGMTPGEYWEDYPISTYVSGNCNFMETKIFLDALDYPTAHPTEGGDWALLEYFKSKGYKCARTKEEMVSHRPETQGGGKYNFLFHWT